jgi:branched-chain amino acid transport system ATP-binding protein
VNPEGDLARPQQSREDLLRAEHVAIHFGGVAALRGVDIRVPQGAIVSLIGPNGAGKTTLFNVLTGEYRPSQGEVWLGSTCTARASGDGKVGLRPDQVTALGVGRTFQNIRLFGQMTTLDNVLIGMHCRLKSRWWDAAVRTPRFMREEKRAETRGLELLELVGLSGRAASVARNLPYGEQRRLEIARALAVEPRLLLLDEPTAGMNPNETVELTALIAGLRDRLGLTVLLIEHDMRVVMRISDRITVLNFGEVIAEGSPEQIQRDPKVIAAYLGSSRSIA